MPGRQPSSAPEGNSLLNGRASSTEVVDDYITSPFSDASSDASSFLNTTSPFLSLVAPAAGHKPHCSPLLGSAAGYRLGPGPSCSVSFRLHHVNQGSSARTHQLLVPCCC